MTCASRNVRSRNTAMKRAPNGSCAATVAAIVVCRIADFGAVYVPRLPSSRRACVCACGWINRVWCVACARVMVFIHTIWHRILSSPFSKIGARPNTFPLHGKRADSHQQISHTLSRSCDDAATVFFVASKTEIYSHQIRLLSLSFSITQTSCVCSHVSVWMNEYGGPFALV